MTYTIAITIALLLFLPVGWITTALAKRTIYSPIRSEDGAQHDEQGERDRTRAIREKSVKKVFVYYFAVVGILFLWAALTEPARKVHAALWPTATPTVTNTPIPTVTRTPSRTPTVTRTGDASNFLTTIAGVNDTGTPTATRTFLPSGGGGGGGIIQTVVVIRTQIVERTRVVAVTVEVTKYVPIPVTVIVTVPVTVIVSPTNNPPLPSLTPSATPTPTHTLTPSPTFTPTFTESPTPTLTETPTP